MERTCGDCPVHPPQLFRTMSSHVLNASKDGDSPNLSGQPLPVLSYAYIRKVFPDVQMKLPVFQFVFITSFALTGYHQDKSVSVSFALSHQIFIHIDNIYSELSLLHAELFWLYLSMTSILRPESSLWPFAGLLPICSCLSFTRNSRTEPSAPDVSLVLTGNKESPPLTCWKHAVHCS